MGSNRTGEVNCKIYSEDREKKINKEFAERNGTDSPRQSSQSPEYVKRTAKLFETTVKITEERVTTTTTEKETVKISLDSLDGEYGKKPSYLGVSCSNSGYRNVINYDSKLREGFWTANSQRESLVLCNSRLRESSPMRFEFKGQNGAETVRMTEKGSGGTTTANGVSQPEKFVNISTSTKTISTFRKSKDGTGNLGEEEDGKEKRSVNGARNFDGGVNLKQILNGETHRRGGYSSLGLSPKILKSPEKNCNSFLKSINSFENNCKRTETERSSTTYRKVTESTNSIQQRIERLYGPGALAQGFYAQKATTKTSEQPEDSPSEGSAQVQKTQSDMTSDVVSSEPCPNGHAVEETTGPEEEETEKNGRYFLKLLKKETDRLERLASFAESELENGENLPEEISGKLRAAAGKARLLVCQKLHQFEGLCQKNLNEKPGEQFPTTSEDLAGFWDMVMLQIVQVYGVFDELEELKRNNWKATPTKKEAASPGPNTPVRTTPKKTTPNGSSGGSQKSESAKKAREEGRRKLLEERRKKMKELKENKIINSENEVEIFAK